MKEVKISQENQKLGSIPSVSLPAITTCRKDAPCYKKCYAARMEKLRKTVRISYERNWDILQHHPEIYFGTVEMTMEMSRFFRWHVSGDIPNKEYLKEMITLARKNPHCISLCMTKQYEIVNEVVSEGIEIPENLRIAFSGWPGLKMDNPYNFPEVHVRLKDGTTSARKDAMECKGHCDSCAIQKCGCFYLQKGEQVVINEH